jgi:hypothetical protein
MVEINLVGLGLGVTLTLLAVSLHYVRGTGWSPTGDISQEVLERRASTVPETDFPEPMNRSIGGGAAPAGAVAGVEEGAEIEEGEATDEAEGTEPAGDEAGAAGRGRAGPPEPLPRRGPAGQRHAAARDGAADRRQGGIHPAVRAMRSCARY